MPEHEAGICPKCKELELVYGAFEIEGDGGYYPCTCSSCNWAGREWYDLSFSIFTADEE